MSGIEERIAEVRELERSVRNHINTHHYQSVLLQDSNDWNQICSSLDVIGDTICSIESYQLQPFPDETGMKYIVTYGILQALFIQQDALRHLSEAFEIEYKGNAILKEIRENRNAAIGHPTKQNRGGECFYNHVSRISLSKNGFDLLRFSKSRPHEMIRVDIISAIESQLDCIAVDYKRISEKLSEIDRMHRNKFKNTQLQDIFHSAMGYSFEKIASGIYAYSYGDKDFGHSNLHMVKTAYQRFEAALKERNELASHTEFDLKEYFHAIEKLDQYFTGASQWMEEADARIYHTYLLNQHEHFVQIAREIDQDYAEKT
ncbi:hypothetical protein DXI23_19300 [Marinobacter flavimaris]|uniref:Uncharacterized protein n=1 Tax=Marinobacter flavimaris TaxID=262076 RepID=A0A3D8GXV0_9GAMM|nr:hypothetical protein [Marinobacter flavimaris]PPI78657.1 hypothetical protein MDHKLMBL_19060 [Marinobacter flavimaris]RDU39280.1 hypothetical protein DXI23_19300 [Marinobacter flavimaris]